MRRSNILFICFIVLLLVILPLAHLAWQLMR
jgi:hypothetical protein